MKKQIFSAKISKYIYALVPITVLLTVPFIISSIINMVRMSSSAEGYLLYIDIVVAVILMSVLVLALTAIFLARYTIKGKSLYIYIGLFFNKIDCETVLNITFYRTKNKLVLFYKHKQEVKQIIINIDEKSFDEFVTEMKNLKKDISYTVQTDES